MMRSWKEKPLMKLGVGGTGKGNPGGYVVTDIKEEIIS